MENLSDHRLTDLFVKRFAVDSALSLPNADAVEIRSLLENGLYKDACEKLIDYYGENSVAVLNRKIHDLRTMLESAENECSGLRESNDAEHDEKLRLWAKAEMATRLVRRFLDFDIRGSDLDCLPMRELLEDAETFINGNEDLLK